MNSIYKDNSNANETSKSNTKNEMIAIIKEWIKMDNELIQLNSIIKEKVKSKKTLTQNLVTLMRNNEIDCFDINGGKLVFKEKKTKKPITKKFLLEQLTSYYKETPSIATELATILLENREEKITYDISRKINK